MALPICADGKAKVQELVQSVLEHVFETLRQQGVAIPDDAHTKVFAMPKLYPVGAVVHIANNPCLLTKKANIILECNSSGTPLGFPRAGTMTRDVMLDWVAREPNRYPVLAPDLDTWLLTHPKSRAWHVAFSAAEVEDAK